MSDHSQDAAPQPTHASPHPAEVAQCLKTFQEAAQALFALYENLPGAAQALAVSPSHQPGEVRSYYFAPAVVHHERKLLAHYRVEDLPGLLTELDGLLLGLVKMMKSTPSDIRVKGWVIASLGALLEPALALVVRMRNVYGKVQPVGQ